MDPTRLEGLKDVSPPVTAAELCEFIHCCRWMSIAIPDFVKRVAPLNDVLEEAYKISKKRTKKSIKNVMLKNLSWSEEHEQMFYSIQNSLRNAVMLAHQKPGYVTCIYTDASDRFWSGVVTQTTLKSLSMPIEKQQHEPLAFLGSEFKDAESRWTMYEKEGFAIFNVFKRLDYLLIVLREFMFSQITEIYSLCFVH
eukprot:IDg23749t1